MDVKIGQIAADQEIMVTQYGGLFINATFGWPALPTADLPSGGPAYPLATPGTRLRRCSACSMAAPRAWVAVIRSFAILWGPTST